MTNLEMVPINPARAQLVRGGHGLAMLCASPTAMRDMDESAELYDFGAEIICAVNAHAALVDALRDLRDYTLDHAPSPIGAGLQSFIDQANAALALAEVK